MQDLHTPYIAAHNYLLRSSLKLVRTLLRISVFFESVEKGRFHRPLNSGR